jgi:uncharacterized protein
MRFSWPPIVVGALVCLALVPAALAAPPASTVVRFSSLDHSQHYDLHATLYLPDGATGPVPAVVVIHGSLGVDSRNDLYRPALLKAGFATFEVDFKSGVYRTVLSRPRPAAFGPMVFAALKELRKTAAVDPSRIAVMGYSLGGHVAIDAAFDANRKAWMGEEKGFAAHVGFYPVTKSYLEQQDFKMTGVPVMILYGTRDSYGDGTSVPALKRLVGDKGGFEIVTVEYPGACHDFNHDAPPENHWDPVAEGHRAHTEWNAEAATDSVVRVVEFLKKALAVSHD